MRILQICRRLPLVLTALLLATSPAAAADVEVYAEGGYTGSSAVVRIYADVNTAPLVGFGVALLYDGAQLAVADASKNAATWYLGDGAANYPYADPDLSVPGEVVVIGGKLDVADPLAGVGPANRVLLGTVRFDRVVPDVDPGADPVAFFGVGLDLGRATPYDNFVGTDGAVYDPGVTFAVQLGPDGDADTFADFADNCTLVANLDQRDTDGDGYGNRCDPDFNNDGGVNFADLAYLKSRFLSGDPDADLNGDGGVNFGDLAILKSMFLGPPGPSGLVP
ncbi:MAG: dockerin type I domain-containing protein [Deferrisomatales bacterium]|nr:dockerin type I domain-containing protein [Deferrisomatales bacterium]